MRGSNIRLLALLLALALLCGCSAPSAAQPEAERPESVEQPEVMREEVPAVEEQPASPDPETPSLVGGGYLPKVSRPQTPYSEMKPSALTREDVQRLCEACRSASESGSQAEFHRAFTAAFDALYELDGSCSLRTLASNADADNTALLDAAADSEALTDEAYDLFFTTMEAISRSEGADLLKKEAPDWLYALIVDYNAEDSAEWLRLRERETALEQDYERLSVAEPLDREALGETFLELIQTRKALTALYDCDDYPLYAYAYLYSRSYKPKDAEAVWKTAKEDFAPLFWNHIGAVQDTLKNAEFPVNCDEASVLRALEEGTAAISPELHTICDYLLQNGLYDLSDDPGKLDVGYTVWISGYDVPFIYAAPTGCYPDYQTLFHEFGHFVGAYCHGSDALFGVCDLDLSELQSQGMEVLFLDRYDELFGDAVADALIAEKVLDFVYSILTGAMFDEFQQRVYREPELTVEKVSEIYAALRREYGFPDEADSETRWMDIIHNFEYPLYYISYAVSAFPVLELVLLQRESPADAADAYLRLAAMGDEEYTLEDVIRESGFVNVLRTPSGDLIAAALEDCGIFDGF